MKSHNHRKNRPKYNKHNNGKNGNGWTIDPDVRPYCGSTKMNGCVVLNMTDNFRTAFDMCVAHNIRCNQYSVKENTYPICDNFYVNERGRLIKPQKRTGKFFRGRRKGKKGLYCNKYRTIMMSCKAIQWCLICNRTFSCNRCRFVNMR